MPSDLSRTIEQATFKYSPLNRAFEKHKKDWRTRKKISCSFRSFILPKNQQLKMGFQKILCEEAIIELNKIKERKKDRENFIKRNKDNFQNFWKTFGRNIYNGTITLKETNNDHADLLVKILNFKKQIKFKNLEKKNKRKMSLTTYIFFLNIGSKK